MNEVLLRNALSAHQRGNLVEAARLYGEILRADPRQVDALCLLALLYAQRGASAEAQAMADRAREYSDDTPASIFKIGCLMQNLGRHAEALACFDKVLDSEPAAFEAMIQRGIVLLALKSPGAALETFEKVVRLRPQDVAALNNRGAALLDLRRYADCVANAEAVLDIQPGNAIALMNRGIAHAELGNYEQALGNFDQAIANNPNYADALYWRGNMLLKLDRPRDALASLDRFLARAPTHVNALICRGVALWNLKKKEHALLCYDRALTLNPNSVEASANRAVILFSLGRFEEASFECDRAFALDPEHPNLAGMGLFYRLQCCDWRALELGRAKIDADLSAQKAVIAPLHYFAISNSEGQQLTCARVYAAGEGPKAKPPLWRGERYDHDRIRIAYVSADFRAHPVAYQIAGVLERHDRRRFETIGVSLGVNDESPIRSRIKAGVERFIDMRSGSGDNVAQRLKEMEIDIAVDLMGLTTGAMPEIFVSRTAPVQVNYLGFPGTIGTAHYDYILADRTVIPEASRNHYSEKIVYLPHTYMPAEDASARLRNISRSEAGLPARAFVFTSFNNSYKFLPMTFAIWMRLLHAIEGSVLWLPASNVPAVRNLIREAQAQGIAADRLIFAPFVMSHDEHIARLAAADLFLDTMPYNAHTTACDVLSAGVPLVTCEGETFAGRVAASILRAANLPELVTHSLEEYEQLALHLAKDPVALAAMRTKVASNRKTSALFDAARYTRDLEAAYVTMWERVQRGLSPENFSAGP